MPLPNTARDWHVDRPLTNLSIAYAQDTSNFIAGRVGTPIPVNFESDQYHEYPQGYWNRAFDTKRSEESVANSISYKVRQKNYSIGDDALRIFISDRKRRNADSQFNLDREGTMLVSNALMIGQELDFRDKFLTTGKWTTDLTGVAATPGANEFLKFSDAGADPVGDWKKFRRDFVLRSGGRMPNELTMTLDVYDTLTEHPSIKDRIVTGTADRPIMVTRQNLAALFEVSRINVVQTIINTAVDGIEDANGLPPVNNEFLASGVMLAAYNEAAGGLMSATAIGNFFIPGLTGARLGPRFRRYRGVEGKDGEYIEGQYRVDRRIVAPDLGQLWSDVL
ncbi:major capsid protein [Shewanella phage S0112]|nr:major capsid protein [Shewanella phage S0112]